MCAFFVLQNRNFEACFSHGDFLKCVKVLDLLRGSFMQDRICQSEKAAARADFVSVGSGGESFACL